MLYIDAYIDAVTQKIIYAKSLCKSTPPFILFFTIHSIAYSKTVFHKLNILYYYMLNRSGNGSRCEESKSMITAYHGIGAFRGQKNPLALARALKMVETGVEICASHQAIGAFGAVVYGHCRAAFALDVYSEIGENGERYATGITEGVQQCPPNTSDDYFSLIAGRDADEWQVKYHSEAWVTTVKVSALWVKSWASPQVFRTAELLAKRRGVELHVIDSRISSTTLLKNIAIENTSFKTGKNPKMADIWPRIGVAK
jgi:hypothetical protein